MCVGVIHEQDIMLFCGCLFCRIAFSIIVITGHFYPTESSQVQNVKCFSFSCYGNINYINLFTMYIYQPHAGCKHQLHTQQSQAERSCYICQ